MSAYGSPVIALVGLPGVGKSTIGRELERRTSGRFIPEDPEAFAFVERAFSGASDLLAINQFDFIATKIGQIAAAGDAHDGALLMEIDPIYCHEVWSRAMLELGDLDTDEFTLAGRLAALASSLRFAPRATIAIDLAPDDILRRITQRARGFEMGTEGVDAEFVRLLEILHPLHEAYVARLHGSGAAVVVLDGKVSAADQLRRLDELAGSWLAPILQVESLLGPSVG